MSDLLDPHVRSCLATIKMHLSSSARSDESFQEAWDYLEQSVGPLGMAHQMMVMFKSSVEMGNKKRKSTSPASSDLPDEIQACHSEILKLRADLRSMTEDRDNLARALDRRHSITIDPSLARLFPAGHPVDQLAFEEGLQNIECQTAIFNLMIKIRCTLHQQDPLPINQLGAEWRATADAQRGSQQENELSTSTFLYYKLSNPVALSHIGESSARLALRVPATNVMLAQPVTEVAGRYHSYERCEQAPEDDTLDVVVPSDIWSQAATHAVVAVLATEANLRLALATPSTSDSDVRSQINTYYVPELQDYRLSTGPSTGLTFITWRKAAEKVKAAMTARSYVDIQRLVGVAHIDNMEAFVIDAGASTISFFGTAPRARIENSLKCLAQICFPEPPGRSWKVYPLGANIPEAHMSASPAGVLIRIHIFHRLVAAGDLEIDLHAIEHEMDELYEKVAKEPFYWNVVLAQLQKEYHGVILNAAESTIRLQGEIAKALQT